jgi:hypothetical protein
VRAVQVERFGGGNIVYIKKIVGDNNADVIWANRSEVTLTLGKVDYCTLATLFDFAKYQIDFDFNKLLSDTKNRVEKVIFNSPATILYVNGKKYVSKVHDEEFDEEKGLLMCLAKANGITHAELKRMIKGAKKQGGNK